MENLKKIYRHIYDEHKEEDGSDKPNELLGEFEIISGDDNDYMFEMIGKKDGKYYNIIGKEVSYLRNKHDAGTLVFVNEIEWLEPIIKQAREDTLRQVLPSENINGDGFMGTQFICDRENEERNKIINKAKEIWGIDLEEDVK